MSPVVLDPSVALKWVLPDEYDEEADGLLSQLRQDVESAFVPPHFYAEVFSGLYRAVREGRFVAERLETTIEAFKRLPVTTEEPAGLWRTAAELGLSHDIGAQTFDLPYLALAYLKGIALWTADTRFHRSLHPAPPWVRLIGPPP